MPASDWLHPMIPGIGRGDSPLETTVSLRLRTILLADDAAPVRRKLLDILHRQAVPASQVQATGDPDEALELFARHHPGVVFAEFVGKRPEDGLDMVLEMLALDPQAKIVLVTSEPRDSLLVRAAIRAGVFAYIEKPLRHEKIRAVISEIESEEGGIERFR
ncbi:MAG: hypothetical protein QOE90_3746 [Thermoplasmata archaeon]|jgi:DNA-binding NtrC family response regulator|nr:hypothetical protein [Thermoplasmata archaeon]